MPHLPSRPIIITGMHRSGTSLTASFLTLLGVRLGDRLLSSDRTNSPGYFEDVDFVHLHRRMLEAATIEGDGGHRDWGWTESESLDSRRFSAYATAAQDLLSARSSASGIWGWKDPRTTLLLDFWDEILEGAALYVLLYRFPWEVADSMQRLGAGVFLENPEYAFRIWSFYNRRLLDFCRRHSDRAILVSSNALHRNPAAFVDLLRNKLGLAVGEAAFDSVWQDDLFASFDPDDPLIRLTVATSPECGRLLDELDAQADLPSSGLWHSSPLRGKQLRPSDQIDLSVIIPCYNQGQLLVEAIASVERTAPERSELLVVNDGSTQPRTLDVLDILRQAGYCIIDQANGGLAAARNNGVRAARGRYILPLDADNRLTPGLVASAIRVLEAEPQIGVVYGDRLEFGSRSGRATVPEFNLEALLWWNFIDACAVWRREIWEASGGYDAGAAVLEDWEFWIAAAKQGWRFCRLSDAAFEYRVRPNSMLATTDYSRLRASWEHVLRKHRALYDQHLNEILTVGRTKLLEAWGEVANLKAMSDPLPKISSDPAGPKRTVRITALMATHDVPEESMPWMEEIRNIFDGLVIFIDEKRVTPGTVTRAEKIASRVLYHKAETWYEWDQGAMARACESDWVFIIERDEQLSPEWQQTQWRQIVETTQFTHFWVPRRWTVPGNRYISDNPWWPDFQLRLLRNNVPGTTFPTTLHDAIHVPGPSACLRDLTIYHHVLWLCSRTTREDRVKYYEQLRPGGGMGHYYLYEDYAPSQAPLPKPVILDINRAIIRMDTLAPGEILKISPRVRSVPQKVSVSEMFWLDVQLTNATNESIYSSPPFPVRFSYHWIQAVTRSMVVFDGERSGVFPCAPANTTTHWKMAVIAPGEPGEYILQTTMVQDGVRWFEQVQPEALQEFAVCVIS